MLTTDDLKNKMTEYQISPSNIQQAALDILENISNGENMLLDPSNPFVFSLEMAATASAVAIDETGALLRHLYPKLANTRSELYHHMSDLDYIGRFATPSESVSLKVILDKNEIISRAIMDEATGIRKVVFPEDTEWNVKGYSFYSHFPIVINILESGGMQVVFDLGTESPLKDLKSNIIEWADVRLENKNMFELTIPVSQVKKTVEEFSITKSTGFSANTVFADQFYHCRAFMSDDGEEWTEVVVTHSDQVYDPLKPTLVVTVEDGVLRSRIPEIYLTSDLIKSTFRIDIYTTKGKVDEDLSVLPPTAYSAKWYNHNNKLAKLVKPVHTIKTLVIYSLSKLEGGSNEKTTQQMKEAVVYNSGGKEVPILKIELEKQLAASGYTLTTYRDHILGRMYMASRILENTSANIFSGINSRIAFIQLDPAKDLNPSTIKYHIDRTTLRPELLFIKDGQATRLLPDSERQLLNEETKENKVDILNDDDFFYSPFFTIVDNSNSITNIRSYYLDKPHMVSRSFIANNKDLGYMVNTKTVSVSRTEDGYFIKVVAEIPDGLEGLNLQLIMNGEDTGERWLIEAETSAFVGTMATFEFSITSSFDIDADNRIELLSMTEVSSGPNPTFIALETPLEFFYSVDAAVSVPTTFDSKFVTTIFENPQSGVTYEKGVIKLGDHLENYYSEARAVLSEPEYARWEDDVPLLYTEDVYARDGESLIFTDDGAGGVELTLVHSIGDPVLDSEENPVYEYRAGDVKLDGLGDPIILNDRDIISEIKIPVFDARYLYAETADVKAYTVNIPTIIKGYLDNDISSIAAGLLESTELPFAPANTNTNAQVIVNSGDITYMDTALRFDIRIKMTRAGFREDSIREQTSESTMKAIVSELKKREISLDSVYDAIKKVVSDEVVSIDISPFLPDGGYARLTRDIDAFSLKSKLLILSNGSIDISDAVSIDYTAVK